MERDIYIVSAVASYEWNTYLMVFEIEAVNKDEAQGIAYREIKEDNEHKYYHLDKFVISGPFNRKK